MELLFDLLWKAAATALVIVLVAKVGERGGALMAAVVMTFPMNAGPGFFFMALEQPPGFIADAALISFAGTGAVLAFVALYVRLARRAGLALGLAGGVLGWLAVSVVTATVPLSLMSAGGIISLGAAVVATLGTARTVGRASTLARASWRYLLGRGLLVGAVIATVAQFANVLGPTMAGLAFSFPTTLIASIWVLHIRYGREFTLATLGRVPAGLVTYGGFCLTLYLSAAGPWPPLGAWAFATLAAVLIAALRASISTRRGAAASRAQRASWAAPADLRPPAG